MESKLDLLIVNRFAALSTNAFDVIATGQNSHYKAEDKLELALHLIKCVGCQYVRCDNITGYSFMCNEISENEFSSELNYEGFIEKALSFDSWVLLSGGVVETVFSKQVASMHVYPQFLTSLVDAINFEQTHFPVIGKIDICKYIDFNSTLQECFQRF